MRRVLVLNQFALPRSSAGGTRHVELFSLLDGWSATVVAGRRNMHDQAPVQSEGILRTVPVTPYRGNGLDRVINWLSFMATAGFAGIRHGRTDLVYGSSPHLGSALTGLALARLRGCAFVLEVRDLWPQILADAGVVSETSRIYRALSKVERFLYHRADRIVVLAEGSVADIVAHGVDPSKIEFVPNGADPKDFEVNTGREDLRAAFEFSNDEFVLVYAGAHGPANGLELALDAAEHMQTSGFRVRLVLVGDGVAKQDLVQSASSRGLRNVTFLDPIPKSEIPKLFAAADVGLHCLADIELFARGVSPNKLYDYMASGLPVLTNTPGETAELVHRAGSGEAVGPNELAVGMEKLISMSETDRAALGRSGRRFMTEHRSRSAMAARLESMFEALVH